MFILSLYLLGPGQYCLFIFISNLTFLFYVLYHSWLLRLVSSLGRWSWVYSLSCGLWVRRFSCSSSSWFRSPSFCSVLLFPFVFPCRLLLFLSLCHLLFLLRFRIVLFLLLWSLPRSFPFPLSLLLSPLLLLWSPLFFLCLFMHLPSLFPCILMSSVAFSSPPSCLSSALLSSVLHRRLWPYLRLFPRCIFCCSIFPFFVISFPFSGSFCSPFVFYRFSCHLCPFAYSCSFCVMCPLFGDYGSLFRGWRFCLILVFLRRWGGGGGVPHVLRPVNVSGIQGASFSFAGSSPFRGGDQ